MQLVAHFNLQSHPSGAKPWHEYRGFRRQKDRSISFAILFRNNLDANRNIFFFFQRGPGAAPRRGPRGSAPGGVKGPLAGSRGSAPGSYTFFTK